MIDEKDRKAYGFVADNGLAILDALAKDKRMNEKESERLKNEIRGMVKEMDGKIDVLACARGRLVNVMLEADGKEEMARSIEGGRVIANAGLALGVAALSDALGGGAGEAFLSMRTEMSEKTPLPDDLESTFRVPDELDEWGNGTAKENG